MTHSVKFTSSIIVSVILTGCSSMSDRNIDVPHIDANQSYFGLDYSQNIIQNIETIQAQRIELAWEEGVSFTERLAANVKGVDPYIGWAPKIDHPAIEERTKTKFEDAIELSLLFDSQPVDVVTNDQLILITFPQNYIWTYSNREINPTANQYLKKVMNLLNKQDVRFSVYSQESFKTTNYGKQWISQAKADRFKDHIVNTFHVDPRMVKSFGLGSKIAHLSKYSQGDFIQLVIYHKYEVDSSEYVSLND